MTDTELLACQQRNLSNYEQSKAEGNLCCEAVFYFDLEQVLSEMNRRKELAL